MLEIRIVLTKIKIIKKDLFQNGIKGWVLSDKDPTGLTF